MSPGLPYTYPVHILRKTYIYICKYRQLKGSPNVYSLTLLSSKSAGGTKCCILGQESHLPSIVEHPELYHITGNSINKLSSNKSTIEVFTPHVPVYFWLNRHNFGDIELKFCILP